MMKKPKRVAVIGLDCAITHLIEKHIEDGHLPNFKKLFAGHSSRGLEVQRESPGAERPATQAWGRGCSGKVRGRSGRPLKLGVGGAA